MHFYEKRKQYELKVLETNIANLTNKQRFISAVVNETIVIMKRKESDILQELENDNYSDCDSLLKLSVKNFTEEKIQELENNIKNLKIDYDNLYSKSEKQLWMDELDIFVDKYEDWIKKKSKSKKQK